MSEPERRPSRLLIIALSLGALALLFAFFVPVIPYMPPTAEEVKRLGVISGSVQVQLTIVEWLELVCRQRQERKR